MPKYDDVISNWRQHLSRFLSKVEQQDDCWLWKGSQVCGYGQFSVGTKSIRAHRFAYAVYKGSLKSGLIVMHNCDNPLCVNPKHLTQGTQSKNIRDCVKRGRYPDRKGQNHGNSKLRDEEIGEIRNLASVGLSQRALGQKFNVSHATIYHVLKGNTWNHV